MSFPIPSNKTNKRLTSDLLLEILVDGTHTRICEQWEIHVKGLCKLMASRLADGIRTVSLLKHKESLSI